MADAYARAAEIDVPGAHIYNVGTGHAVAIAEILSTLLEFARVPVRAELDRSLVRRTAPALALDATRFRERTGWAPRTDLRTSLRDLLDHWRDRTRQEVRT